MVPNNSFQAEDFRNRMNALVRIAVGRSPKSWKAPTSGVMDDLHREGQFREDLLGRERSQVGMGIGMHSNVISEFVERGQK